jgi:hypothetical protein
MATTYAQVEYLLENYNIIKAKALQRGVELDNLLKNKQETTRSASIEELALACRDPGSGLNVHTGRISDITSWVALNYDLISSTFFQKSEKQIIREIRVFGNLALKTEIAVKGLDPRTQRIIKMAYWERRGWAEIGKKFYLDKAWCQAIKRQGIRTMQQLINLDAMEIDYLLKLAGEAGEGVAAGLARKPGKREAVDGEAGTVGQVETKRDKRKRGGKSCRSYIKPDKTVRR